jgi:hypothetical protein
MPLAVRICIVAAVTVVTYASAFLVIRLWQPAWLMDGDGFHPIAAYRTVFWPLRRLMAERADVQRPRWSDHGEFIAEFVEIVISDHEAGMLVARIDGREIRLVLKGAVDARSAPHTASVRINWAGGLFTGPDLRDNLWWAAESIDDVETPAP